jgi:hypothetical protein
MRLAQRLKQQRRALLISRCSQVSEAPAGGVVAEGRKASGSFFKKEPNHSYPLRAAPKRPVRQPSWPHWKKKTFLALSFS